MAGGLAGAAPPHRFEVGKGAFLLDGQPFQILSGELHYPRIPRAYWRDRLQKAKAMGLNTVCTYVFWNVHEPKPGVWDFSGEKDLAAFVRTAQEEGLFVLLRPGPYVCAEWDLGGFPAWLLRTGGPLLRSADPAYLSAQQRYFERLGKELRDLQVTRGGPILMVQVENEYGSFGNDGAYVAAVRDGLRTAGFEVPLFTADWPDQGSLKAGALPDATPTVNFGSGAAKAFPELAKFRPDAPGMNGEFWCGWFDAWGRPHRQTSAADKAKEFAWMVERGHSVNIYMFHGGTNWGFWAGANGSDSDFAPDTTSYDYSAVLDEAGAPTDKFEAFRKVLQARRPDAKLPDLPSPLPRIALPPVSLGEWAPLETLAGPTVKGRQPLSMEDLGATQGFVRYRTRVRGPLKADLACERVHDVAYVSLDGRRVATLDRRLNQRTVRDLVIPKGSHTLELLVEHQARINYGEPLRTDRKGLLGAVRLGGREVLDWEMATLPCEDLAGLRFQRGEAPAGKPAFRRGTFTVTTPGDTFLDMGAWGKGLVWVNGHNLGRHWSIGPQQTLFLPGCWLKPGANELVVLELLGTSARTVEGRTAPRFEVKVDPASYARKPGAQLVLDGRDVLHNGRFAPGEDGQEVRFAQPGTGRFVCLEALSAQDGGPLAAITELLFLDADGKPIPREACRVVYADSEELKAENGSAWLVFDQQPETRWTTQHLDGRAPYPHALVVDLGAERTVGGFRYQPRRDGVAGRIQDYRIHLRRTPFSGVGR